MQMKTPLMYMHVSTLLNSHADELRSTKYSVLADGGSFNEQGLLPLSSIHREWWCFGIHAIFKTSVSTFRDPESTSWQEPTDQCPTFLARLKVYSTNSTTTSMLSFCMEFTFWQPPFYFFLPLSSFMHSSLTQKTGPGPLTGFDWTEKSHPVKWGRKSPSVRDDMYGTDGHLSFSRKEWDWEKEWLKNK